MNGRSDGSRPLAEWLSDDDIETLADELGLSRDQLVARRRS